MRAPSPRPTSSSTSTRPAFESDVLQRSTEVPVVIDFWAEWCEPCKQLSPVLERLAVEYNGRFLLAKIDVDANQMLMQQFGVQGIPAVFAVVAGQALPLFQGAAGEQQIRQTLDQLVQVGEERFGLTGLVVDPEAEPGAERPAAPERPAGPHDAALDAAVQAMDAGDLGGAVQAYKNVLAEEPGNTEAKLGLAQAELLQRVQDADPQKVRREAADKPGDAQAQIAAADLDWWAVTWRTPSGASSTRCASRRATTGTPYGCGCWSCSRWSAPTTRGWPRRAGRSPAPCSRPLPLRCSGSAS